MLDDQQNPGDANNQDLTPYDEQEKATQTVLEQVELLGWEVAA